MTAAAHTDSTTIDRIEVPAAMVPGLTDRSARNMNARRLVKALREVRDCLAAGELRQAAAAAMDAEWVAGLWHGGSWSAEMWGEAPFVPPRANRLVLDARYAVLDAITLLKAKAAGRKS